MALKSFIDDLIPAILVVIVIGLFVTALNGGAVWRVILTGSMLAVTLVGFIAAIEVNNRKYRRNVQDAPHHQQD